ncbi:TlpA disulfide reductase family protein [Magnetospira thiophila]
MMLFGSAQAANIAPVNAWEIPSAPLPDLSGQTHEVAEWKGKIILLNFFATWCLPCQVEIADLKRWQKAHGKSGLQVIGISLDETRKIRNFVRSLEISYPVLVAGPGGTALMALWGNRLGEVPYTVIIAPDGNVPYVSQGAFSAAAFDRYVVPLLQK